MSIAVNIEKTMGDFQLNTEFYADIGITAIFGPSGAGKSTLVNLIAGLVKPDTGYIKILILDEPLTGLDEGLKAEVIPYLEFVRDNFKIPILYISHSQSEVVRLSDRIVVLEKGRILEQGKTLQILSSFSVAKKLGLRDLSSFVEAKVSKHASDGITELDFAGSKLFLPKIDAILGSKVYLRILAKDITLAIEKPKKISALNILQVKVDEVILGNGPGAIVGIEVGGHKLTTRITQRSLNAMNLKHGQTCFAFLKTVSVATSDIIT